MKRLLPASLALAVALCITGCDSNKPTTTGPLLPNKNPFPSTYQIPSAAVLVIQNANLLTGANEKLDSTDLIV